MFLGNARHPCPFWRNIVAREELMIIVGSMGILGGMVILEEFYEC